MDDFVLFIEGGICTIAVKRIAMRNGSSSQKSVSLAANARVWTFEKECTGTVPDKRGCVLSSPTRCRWYGSYVLYCQAVETQLCDKALGLMMVRCCSGVAMGVLLCLSN